MAPHRILSPHATPGLSRRLSERARAHQGLGHPPSPTGAAAVEGMRAALRDLLGRAMADGSQTGPAMEAGCTAYAPGEAPPRQPRSEIRSEAGGWRILAELPGTAPEAVALAIRDGVLLIHASGPFRYEARLALPAGADPHSLRWHCTHGLLEGRLAPRGREDEA
ncbi:Hsp20/alpha crystallin family protein [Teichococcus aestuarii]|uniref:Hsp20/alpha crystallin family protein n=1 Tax=Teichococcus aestuarii TaxID=568898 RepID=UPI003605B425